MTSIQLDETRASSGGAADAAADGRADEERQGDVRQYVTFTAGDEVFAVDMAPVQEIIRVPEVVRVPLAPETLDGLANLRGKVLPIVSLRRVFGFEERARDEAARALVIDVGQPLGFVVDTVASVIGVEESRIEGTEAIEGTVNTDVISGVLKDVGGHAMIMVLDFERLIAREFAQVVAVAQRAAATMGVGGEGANDDEVPSDELQLVSFEVAGQEYAIGIADVKEIVQMPASIVRVPRAEPHVLGMMTLRQQLLPLVSLRRLFNLPAREADERSRIVVVAVGTASVGIVMDSVNEVLRVGKASVDAVPELLARGGDLSEITQICRLDDGKRLVSIISAPQLLRFNAIQEALSAAVAHDTNTEREEDEVSDGHDDDEQVVVFRLDREEFGVPIDSVQEIVRVPDELTRVPKSPAFVEGVINLRGAVLPVIDLRRRLGLSTTERTDRQRIMVFLIEGMRTGFIVDSVAEVLKIPRAAIAPSPRLSGEQGALLARVANLQQAKRMVQLLAPAHLVGGQELDDLAAMAA